MATAQILQALQELRRPFSRRLPSNIIVGMTQSLTQARYQLISTRSNPRGPGFQVGPTNGVESLTRSVQATRKLMTIQTTLGYTAMLNQALAGGESYPVLSAILGTAAGVASAGAGLIFTIATTALDASRTHQGVQARVGDELWQVEEIGKVRDGSSWEVVHVGSYFLIDPFRRQTVPKGWLIHEERTVLDV